MNDNELFELCKEVDLASGWKTDYFLSNPIDTKDKTYLYTSDYLLEKLPLFVNNEPKDELSLVKTDINWGAGYYRAMDSDEGVQYLADPNFSVNADTPLKALLKLTLALHKAGELK